MRDFVNVYDRPALAGIDFGVEPAIEIDGRRHGAIERRLVSARWLAGTILTGVAGGTLIGLSIYTALHRNAVRAKPPEFAVQVHSTVSTPDAGPQRSDRLVRKADVVAERQSFRAPTTVTVGDKQVIRLRTYTRVGTTLTLTPTDLADQVPPFNPLKMLGDDQPAGGADVPADPGPALDASEVAFTTRDMLEADPAAFGGGLTKADVAAQVNEQIRVNTQVGAKARVPLPPQFLLMRASRPSLDPANLLAFAGMAPAGSAAAASNVRMTPENVLVVPRSEAPRDAIPEERLVVLRHGDTLDGVLRDSNATREQIKAITDAFGARPGQPPVPEGRRLRVMQAVGEDGKPHIARLSVYADETLETTIALTDDGHYVKVETVEPKAPARPAASADDDADQGGMRLYDSIYQTALKQQIPPAVIATMVRIFSNDIDFQQAVQGGDSFDAFYADDEDGDGRQDLLFASVTVRNEVFRYYRFAVPDDPTPEYFDDNGRSLRKFLIRTPVPSGIFTSGFGVRFHPVLGYTRPHTGVDWAAPVGTPILAAGNGTLIKVERSSSYGNHIELQHANGYITTYSHMVGFARGMAEGVKVRQGQVIGYLGQTGLATGPHLHYEVIVNGRFVDPMRVKLTHSRDIQGPALADFKREHDRIDGLMASASNALPATPQTRAAN